MALARVVSFDRVSRERMDSMAAEMQDGERPEGVPATEMILLHDREAETALAILFFDNEDDYQRGDAALDAMPTGDTPGRRTAVAKYTIATRTTS
jgi:hypothetical protein